MRKILALTLGFLLGLAFEASGQSLPRPDDHVLRPAWDGFTAPRLVHHASRSILSLGTYAALRVLHVRPERAATVSIVLNNLPHPIGVATKRYPFDGPDWAADFIITSSPVLPMLWERRGWGAGLRAIGVYVILYSYAARWASP